MTAVDVLRELGLTGNEAKVYFALCELGPSVASEVAEKAGVHRALAYGVLARLIEKGLASQVTKEGKKLFEAASPARLQAIVEEREHRIKEGVASLVAELSKVYRTSAKPTAEIFVGMEGIKTILTEELASTKRGDVIYYYRAQPELAKLAKVFVSWYHKKRVEKGVIAKAIFDSSSASLERANEFAALPLTEVRILVETLPTPITYHIFADKVAILSISREEALGILVKSEAISSFFRNNFEFTWKKLKTLERKK